MTRMMLAPLVLLAALLVLPDLVAAQPVAHSTYNRRKPGRSTWAPVPRPRRDSAPNRLGLYLGGGILGDYLIDSGNDLTRFIRTGWGGELFLGLRLSPSIALELGGGMSFHDTDPNLQEHYDQAILSGLTLDLKYFLMPSSVRIEPFLQGGAGFYTVSEEGLKGREMTGGGWQAGGGVEVRLSPSLGLGGRVLYKGMYMDNGTDILPATRSVYLNHLTGDLSITLHF
ncbi:MAG: hypothetical protein FJ109_03485 [Deltaproteobacteria bacterium]|nr:hypothetical protein [Deltaproteobacteria bacterium]